MSSLYRDLFILIENGDNILKLFKQHNNGKSVHIDEIKKYLQEQHILIPRLTKVLRKRDIQTILSIQAPEINPLQFLLFEKGFRVKFYLDKINKQESIIKRLKSKDIGSDEFNEKILEKDKEIELLTDQLADLKEELVKKPPQIKVKAEKSENGFSKSLVEELQNSLNKVKRQNDDLTKKLEKFQKITVI